jgi:hypothetical protein
VSIHFSFFFTLAELFFCSTQTKEATRIRHSANYQNIVALEDERGALSSRVNQLQWLGFGLLVGLEALNRIKRLDCAPSSFTSAFYRQGQGEKQWCFAAHLRIPCFSLPCKLK